MSYTDDLDKLEVNIRTIKTLQQQVKIAIQGLGHLSTTSEEADEIATDYLAKIKELDKEND